MGTHNWIDNNNNGIQELNEFDYGDISRWLEYVVNLLPSNQLEDIYFLDYKQSINSTFNKITKRKFLKRYISKIFIK